VRADLLPGSRQKERTLGQSGRD